MSCLIKAKWLLMSRLDESPRTMILFPWIFTLYRFAELWKSMRCSGPAMVFRVSNEHSGHLQASAVLRHFPSYFCQTKTVLFDRFCFYLVCHVNIVPIIPHEITRHAVICSLHFVLQCMYITHHYQLWHHNYIYVVSNKRLRWKGLHI